MLQVCLNSMSLELWLNNIILGIQGIPCLLRKSVNLFILKNTVWLIKNGVIYLQLEEFIWIFFLKGIQILAKMFIILN